jgi:hypothetical protein
MTFGLYGELVVLTILFKGQVLVVGFLWHIQALLEVVFLF